MKTILKILLLLLLVVIVVLAGFIYTLDINSYKDDIISLVEENTGRDFTIDGDLGLAVSLVPTIRVEGVRLGNAEWAGTPDMMSIGRFEAEIALLPLLGRNIQIDRLILHDSEIFLETNTEGRGNWVFSEAPSGTDVTATPPAGTSDLPALNISEISITDFRLTYRDGVTDKTTVLVLDQVTSTTSSFSEPTDLTVEANYNNTPVEITATLGSLETLLADREYPLHMEIRPASAVLEVDGRVMQPLQGKGVDVTVSFSTDRLSDLNSLAETELPDIGPIRFSGRLRPEGGLIRLSELQLLAGRTELTGELTVQTGGTRPVLTASLQAPLIDLTPFMGEEKAGSQPAEKQAKVFSDAPLPLESLKSVDADVQLAVARLVGPDLEIENIDLPLKLQGGHLQIAPLNAQMAGGDMAVNLDLDSGQTPAALQLGVAVEDLELGKLPGVEKEQSITGGITNINIDATGRGGSIAAIMAGLNGKILIDVGSGTLSNKKVDLIGADLITEAFTMLNPLAKKEDTSQMECAAVNIDINEGMATIDRGIAMQTSKMYIIGDGTINLATEDLDLSVVPYARQGIGIGVGSLASLVKFGGTLANPKPVADPEEVLKAGISAGTAIANSGVSLLSGERAGSADINPCDAALGRAEPATTVTPAESGTESGTGSTLGDTVKGATDKVKGALKGIFGGD